LENIWKIGALKSLKDSVYVAESAVESIYGKFGEALLDKELKKKDKPFGI
jgi:hypothetical protein